MVVVVVVVVVAAVAGADTAGGWVETELRRVRLL